MLSKKTNAVKLLPDTNIIEITEYLSLEDVIRFSLTDKRLYNLITKGKNSS